MDIGFSTSNGLQQASYGEFATQAYAVKRDILYLSIPSLT